MDQQTWNILAPLLGALALAVYHYLMHYLPSLPPTKDDEPKGPKLAA